MAGDITTDGDELIIIVIDSVDGQFSLRARRKTTFQYVASFVCEQKGWQQNKTRFLFDGERLQDDLSLIENQVGNNEVIDAFHELVGGKGPDDKEKEKEKEILKMLDDCSSDPDESEESDDDHTVCNRNSDKELYEELKLALKDGKLKLDRKSDQDMKLCLLLETDDLQPYELIRLKNVYSFWKQHSTWREAAIKEDAGEPLIEVESSIQHHSHKMRIHNASFESLIADDDSTPNKRRRLLESFGLNTPSPLVKKSQISEIEMKQISVAVHLWAERKMGGTKFLQSSRLNNSHFEDILKFTGPESKWKLMKGRTLPQLRSLWRNTTGGKHLYRGHMKTGFENEDNIHIPSDPFCPFGHCVSGIMSPMDIDLIVLTPKLNSVVIPKKKRILTSRKLFEENNVESDKAVEDSFDEEDRADSVLTPADEDREEIPVHDESKKGVSYGFSKDCNENLEITGKESEVDKRVKSLADVEEPSFHCKINGCRSVFQTFFGLERHNIAYHSDTKLEKAESTCPVCNKKVIYLDQHIKAKHSDLQKPLICEICQKEVKSSILKHRKLCTKCIFCDYTNERKGRLLSHIKSCLMQTTTPIVEVVQQEEPLDLISPFKFELNKKDDNLNGEKETLDQDPHQELIDDSKGKKVQVKKSGKRVDDEKETLQKGRKHYPFDKNSTEEEYFSEYDVDDTDSFTIERRKKKDEIELKLRTIDDLVNPEIEGDDIIIGRFSEFMRNKRHQSSKEEGFSKQTEPTTINMYTNVVKNDILKAFHKLVAPFDARWLIDCTTPKICKFEGEERMHVSPKEPIYLTSRILQEALDNTRTQKKRVIAVFNQLMAFIELFFTLKLNAFGVEVLNRVITYHNGVKSFIKATSQWKKSKEEENEAYEANKLLKDYQHPNKDVEVLEKYKEYIKSEERILKITKLLSYASPEAEAPSAAVITELGINVMEEIVACTGCRPKVVRHMNMGSYVDAKPGFNPYDLNGEDATLQEDIDGEKIWRRVDPNLPPKGKACIHQIRDKSAICSENCENKCDPEGFNFWITWDKTQSTKGPYYLHIPTPIKNLMDRYDIVRTKFFNGKKPKFEAVDSWLEDFSTPLFLNSACNSFPSLETKKLSVIFGIDITAYAFRKIISTWALTHKSQEIRAAEEEALQHSLHVAKERYMQAKQVQPQTLVQTYTQEENLFPEKFRMEIDKDKSNIERVIAEKKEKRSESRYSKLVKEKEIDKKLKFSNRPLGPRNSVLDSDRHEFAEALEIVTKSNVTELATTLKPIQWRDLVVRLVFSSPGENGNALRDLWIKFYKGNLRFGIRDERKRAKELNWPLRKQNTGRKDRNSWIAHTLRKSFLAAQQYDDMKK